MSGNAINRQSQLSLRLSDTKLHPQDDGSIMLATGGLFAPTIRQDSLTSKVYVINTNVIHPEDGGNDICQNFIVSTDDVHTDAWSDPVFFDFDGIDPSLFWEDGKVYMCGSRGPGPMTKINLFQIDLKTGEKLSEEETIWNGTGGIYPEGPHIFKRNDWYYLLISEGGTFKGHMITVARSKSIWGPYESATKNPILSANGTDEYVQCTGHADMAEDQNGDWWGVCLAMRMKGDRFMMGRESFIIPARFGEWPELDQVTVEPKMKDFKTTNLKPKVGADWLYIRDANLAHHQIDEPGKIKLTSSRADISQWKDSVSFIGKRQRKLTGAVSVVLEVPPAGRAGLVNYKDEHRYARIFVDVTDRKIVFEIVNNASKIKRTETASLGDAKTIELSIEYTEETLTLQYGVEDGHLKTLGTADTAELSNADFVGPILGVFAVSEQDVNVSFRSFSIEE